MNEQKSLNHANNSNIDKTAIKENFKQWLANPSSLRSPKTQLEFANKLGVHHVTLSKWKTNKFMDEVIKLAQAEIRQNTPDVMKAVVKYALEGSAQHAKIYFDYIERFSNLEDQEGGMTLKKICDDIFEKMNRDIPKNEQDV